MTNLSDSKLFVFILILLPIVMSCAEMKSRVLPISSTQTSATDQDFSQTSSQTLSKANDLVKKHMEAGEFQKAIDVYYVEYKKYPHDLSLEREYVKSIENIASVADKALDNKDFASSGKIYDVLLKNYAHFEGFKKKISFNSTHLNEKLNYCKKALFKRGFQEYRIGNLSGAIAVWQDLLAIDPQNTEIKESLRTAKLQQKNLQEKE